MENKTMNCCKKNKSKEQNKKEKGILAGIIYGLIPHIGCIGFIIFSILGATAATAVFRPLLLNPYFSHILIGLAFIFATIAAIVYLKKNNLLSWLGIKRKKGYLFTLYGTTIAINLILFIFIFPVAANVSSGSSLATAITQSFSSSPLLPVGSGSLLTLRVDIPCPGHGPLITGELKTINGVENVRFRFPDLFDVVYNQDETSVEQIISLDIFNTYQATIY